VSIGQNIRHRIANALSYDAVKTTHRRKAPSRQVMAEHVALPKKDRQKLLATTQNQQRNAALAAWMVRRHLDYVSKFRMQVSTESDSLNTLVKRLFDWHAQPRNFDIAERFGREEMFRMFELEKVVNGDAAMIKLASGHLQSIESDMIAQPSVGRWNPTKKQHERLDQKLLEKVDKDTGVVMDTKRPGRIAQYCICNRQPDGKKVAFDHLEDAENIIFDAYYTRFSSQVRGVSPLATAINSIQDIYEGIDYNLAKAKVHALFGIAIMREYSGGYSAAEEAAAMGAAAGLLAGAEAETEAESEEEEASEKIKASLQKITPSELLMVDMDTRGRIDTIESKTPSTEFKNFMEFVIAIALLSLDIPFSAFNSRASSFSAIIADNNLYEVSCRPKREKNLWKRREYSDWLIEREWNNPASDWGLKEAATRAGVTRLRELQEAVEWIPSGFPWLQKIQEVEGDVKAISIGLDNPIDAARRRGGDAFANIDKTAKVYEYAKEKGVPLAVGVPGQTVISDEDGENKEDGQE
jgi:capsid protein